MQITEANTSEQIISRLCVVGINFNNATATERSLFAITAENRSNLLDDAKQQGFTSVFALSTCNRSEIYGYCQHDHELSDLFISHTNGTEAIFRMHGFTKRGTDALDHLFKVAGGLHSQITGDYEIVSQLKYSVAESRKAALIGPVMDRTINFAMQASKAVRTHTNLSNGTVSVSYAAIEWLQRIKDIGDRSVLLVGAGTLAKNIIRNLQHYLKPGCITVINRTDATAKELAQQTDIKQTDFSNLQTAAFYADIIIVCTNAPSHLLFPDFFTGDKQQYILDLSVPENVHPDVRANKNIQLAGIDEVSQKMQLTFANRNAEIPKANNIIAGFLNEFYSWVSMYTHVPAINRIKSTLYAISEMPFCENDSKLQTDNKVNKTVGALAMNLRHKNEKGCQYINAINDFLNHKSLYE